MASPLPAETRDALVRTLRTALNDSQGITSTVRKLLDKLKDGELDYAQGPSLLTLKIDTLLGYVQNLALLSASRLLSDGSSGSSDASQDLVDNLIRQRLVLEKARPLEKGLKYQLDRMLRAAIEAQTPPTGSSSGAAQAQEADLLAYGPGMSSAFQVDPNSKQDKKSRTNQRDADDAEEGDVYRPPKLAAVAYDPDAKRRRRGAPEESDDERQRTHRSGVLLSELTASMSGVPLEEGASGTGVSRPSAAGHGGIGGSKRARELAEMQEYEENNFTRLTLSKRDQQRRERDEADLALGGARGGRGKSGQRAGFESELAGLLGDERPQRSTKKNRKNDRPNIDVYDQLRSSAGGPTMGKKQKRKAADLGGDTFTRNVREKRRR